MSTDFNKELDAIFSDYRERAGWTSVHSSDPKDDRTEETLRKAIKKAVDKHLLVHMITHHDMDFDTVDSYDDAFAQGGFRQIDKQRQSLWGTK